MATVGKELPPEVQAALARGQKIEAIKLLREARGMGLKEAKEAVEACQPERRMDSDSVVQGGGSRLPWLVVAIVLVLAAVWLLGGF